MATFTIFNDYVTGKTGNNVSRKILSNNVENLGKNISSGPFKPNEPLKRVDNKISFLSNKGNVLNNTPMRKAFAPRPVNVGSVVYRDTPKAECEKKEKPQKMMEFDEIEFTKVPVYDDIFDFAPLSRPMSPQSPPRTPPPNLDAHDMDFDCSYHDDLFSNKVYENVNLEVEELSLPDLY